MSTTKKPKFKKNDRVFWNSKKQFKRIEGIIERIESFGNSYEYIINCEKDGRWGVEENKLKKVK